MAAKSAELEMLSGDVDRANQQIAALQKEVC